MSESETPGAGLRDAGAVVWLERYGVWAMARYAEVHEALRDWSTFCSSAGVGLSGFRRETPWRPPSLLLQADPPALPGRGGRRGLAPRPRREPAASAGAVDWHLWTGTKGLAG